MKFFFDHRFTKRVFLCFVMSKEFAQVGKGQLWLSGKVPHQTKVDASRGVGSIFSGQVSR